MIQDAPLLSKLFIPQPTARPFPFWEWGTFVVRGEPFFKDWNFSLSRHVTDCPVMLPPGKLLPRRWIVALITGASSGIYPLGPEVHSLRAPDTLDDRWRRQRSRQYCIVLGICVLAAAGILVAVVFVEERPPVARLWCFSSIQERVH